MRTTSGLARNQKGAAAEAVIEAEAIKRGVAVYRPMSGHSRADLIFEIGDRMWRVQVKHGHVDRSGNVLIVNTAGSYLSAQGYVHSTYSEREIDLFAVWSSELDRCFLLPPSIFANRSAVHLRLTPSRNNQQAGINLADEYDFDGAVAQLARAFGWQPKGQGFESPQLHSDPPPGHPVRRVGCDQAYRTWGRLIDEVAGGEEIIITRRGSPRIRLSPL
jgi:hypothetical protein